MTYDEKRLYDRRRRRGRCVGCGVDLNGGYLRCERCFTKHQRRLTTSYVRNSRPWTKRETELAQAIWRGGGASKLELLRQIATRLNRSASGVRSKLRNEDGILPPDADVPREFCSCGLTKDKDHQTCDMGPITSYMRQQEGAWPEPPQ